MKLLQRIQMKWGLAIPIIAVDVGLVITAMFIFVTDQVVFLFHIIFVLLSIGAFFWNFRAFTVRAIFWVAVTTSAVLLAVWQGRAQPGELIQILLLTIILIMVFIISSFRASVQRDLEREHKGLKQVMEERQMLQEALRQQAFYDKLTGLPNRALLFDRLRHAFLEAVRHEQSLSLLFMDLDGFKAVNDRFGHAMGDKLLIEVAKRLLSVVRKEDTVARLGGDEFTVLIKNPLSVDVAVGTANRILETISEPYQMNGLNDLSVSVSIGVAMTYPKSDQSEELMQDADRAMYQAKAEGRSKINVHKQPSC